jgi:hypothetical protein
MQENQVTLVDQMYAWGQGESALYPHCHDFYDWFCSDASLDRRAKSLQNKVIKLVNYFREKGNPIDCSKVYVFFKNNCPMSGPLYDSFSICDRESGDVLFWVTPKSGHSGKAEIFSRAKGFNEPLAEADNFSQLLKLI